jgi:hypothetical protein
LINAWQTLQLIMGIPPCGVGVYGGGNSSGRMGCGTWLGGAAENNKNIPYFNIMKFFLAYFLYLDP